MYGPDAPPPPDYSGITAAQTAQSEKAFQLGQDQLAWAKQQYASDKEVTDKVVNSFLDTMNTNSETAAKDRARYETQYQPLEDQLIKDADSYASPERKDLEMGRAQAAVGQQFDAARNSATQNLESFGIDPSSTRYGALDIGMRAQQAAATAAAGNQASQAVDATGRALRSEAINIGRGYPGQIAGQYGTATAAGTNANANELATTASGSNTMGNPTSYFGNSMAGLNGAANTMNMGYNNILGMTNANNQSSGFGALAGLVGAGVGSYLRMAEGGLADASQTPGGAIPMGASASGGQAVDDVDAKLTAGEFVVPKDVAAWKGEEFFQKLIDNSRKSKDEASAKPAVGMAQQGPPTFVSRPGGALPVG
jgi:hypothetical protein